LGRERWKLFTPYLAFWNSRSRGVPAIGTLVRYVVPPWKEVARLQW
jgi:hypothetical protein